MKKTKAFYLIVVLALLAVSVVMFSGIAQAGAVPDGFMGVPWGASTQQIIKTMKERGYEQLTSRESNLLHFRGAFAGVPCDYLSFEVIANSLCSGGAYSCAWSTHHRGTQASFERIVNELSEKYGPPLRRSQTQMPEEQKPKECKGLVIPFEYASWNFVDSRSDQYSIGLELRASGYYDMTEKVTPCRVDISIWYRAESLEKRLKKKDY